jgi:hypothetical protein
MGAFTAHHEYIYMCTSVLLSAYFYFVSAHLCVSICITRHSFNHKSLLRVLSRSSQALTVFSGHSFLSMMLLHFVFDGKYGKNNKNVVKRIVFTSYYICFVLSYISFFLIKVNTHFFLLFCHSFFFIIRLRIKFLH